MAHGGAFRRKLEFLSWQDAPGVGPSPSGPDAFPELLFCREVPELSSSPGWSHGFWGWGLAQGCAGALMGEKEAEAAFVVKQRDPGLLVGLCCSLFFKCLALGKCLWCCWFSCRSPDNGLVCSFWLYSVVFATGQDSEDTVAEGKPVPLHLVLLLALPLLGVCLQGALQCFPCSADH